MPQTALIDPPARTAIEIQQGAAQNQGPDPQPKSRAERSGTLDLSVDFVTDLQLRFGTNPVELFEAYLEQQINADLAFTSDFTAS